jgi:hypothetical protein
MKSIKMTHMIRVYALAVIAVVAATACTEKTDVKLNDADPKVVIEMNITDNPGPYYMLITKSKVYYENNNPVPITDAVAVITDNMGHTDTLTQVLDGLYFTNTLQGTPGVTYYMQVYAEGTLYTATCTMPQPVNIDSLTVITEQGGGFGGGSETNQRIICRIKDPAGIANSYRILQYKDAVLQNTIDVHNDALWDGKIREFRVDNDVNSGDSVKIELCSIDKSIYNYLNELSANGNPFSQPAAPANPTTNISGQALGYFNAQSVKAMEIIVP